MMAIAIITFGILALAHLMYESVLAPSLRVSLRFQLFALRDQLRTLKVERGDHCSDEAYRILEHGLNSAIHILPKLSMHFVSSMGQAFKADPKLSEDSQARQRIVDACGLPELAAIRERAAVLAFRALLVNSGALMVWLAPFAIGALAFGSVKRLVTEVLFSPREFDKEMHLSPALV